MRWSAVPNAGHAGSAAECAPVGCSPAAADGCAFVREPGEPSWKARLVGAVSYEFGTRAGQRRCIAERPCMSVPFVLDAPLFSLDECTCLVRAANAAIQAVDPSGAVCFLNSVKTAPCNGWNGRHYGECQYVTDAGQPSVFGGSCTAQDRRAWAQWSARPSQCVQRNAQNCFFWPNDQFCG